jgi:hypothetical protein
MREMLGFVVCVSRLTHLRLLFVVCPHTMVERGILVHQFEEALHCLIRRRMVVRVLSACFHRQNTKLLVRAERHRQEVFLLCSSTLLLSTGGHATASLIECGALARPLT